MSFYFNNFVDFIAMDGHGVYVWTCWSIVCVVLMSLVIGSGLQRKKLLQQLSRQQIKQAKRHGNK